MDLDKILPRTGEMAVRHPVTGEPTDAVILVAGVDSEQYQTAQRQAWERRLDRSSQGRAKPTFEEFEQDGLELLVACTLGWRGLVKEGQELAYSPAAARKLYSDPRYVWLRTQVDRFIGDRANFFPA